MSKTRDKLILACEELALKKGRGFYNLSLEELAKEAGVSKRTIYRYFGSKEELFEATVEEVMDRVLARYMEVLGSERDPRKAFLTIIKNITYLINRQVIADLANYYPLLWQKINKLRQSKLESLLDYTLSNSQVKLRWRVDPRIFKAAFFTAMTEVINPRFILESGMPLEEVGLNFMEMFFFGAFELLPAEGD
ncbi:MAG TPA: TetR/AcrR family transcriptional regulator [Peptococcaceae bacterium]|nr:TetR/AcrR family transcriptional regulator [Peptococcaceae bacterium]